MEVKELKQTASHRMIGREIQVEDARLAAFLCRSATSSLCFPTRAGRPSWAVPGGFQLSLSQQRIWFLREKMMGTQQCFVKCKVKS